MVLITLRLTAGNDPLDHSKIDFDSDISTLKFSESTTVQQNQNDSEVCLELPMSLEKSR